MTKPLRLDKPALLQEGRSVKHCFFLCNNLESCDFKNVVFYGKSKAKYGPISVHLQLSKVSFMRAS